MIGVYGRLVGASGVFLLVVCWLSILESVGPLGPLLVLVTSVASVVTSLSQTRLEGTATQAKECKAI